ncbi:MAG: FAD-binding oxidoreductase [Methylobacteriaceae bacterium]|jgi:sarcosine oxidase subunit beta|nr:FAD-binding oxidoreductase [Methylobacteriaceae bacterium]
MTPVETDVVVVGGGGAGCSTAWHLALRNTRVVLLERGLVGGQASGVNYGGVRQQGRDPAELPISARSREIWQKLKSLIGTEAEYVVSGHLKLARNDEEAKDLERYLEVAAGYGLELRYLPEKELKQEFPWLGPKVVAGSYCATDGAANPRLLAPAIARAARDAGADIRQQAEVVDIAHDGDTFTVATKEAVFRAPVLVNTAGYWGGAIAERFGEPAPISSFSPNMAVTEPIPYFIVPNLGVVGGDIYLRQIDRGNVIFGGGRGFGDPERVRSRPSALRTMESFALALELVPQLKGVEVIRSWTGIDGDMPDHIPVVGPSSTTKGLFHAFGFSGHGFQLGPGIGAIMSELVLDGKTPTPIEPLSIGRFAG